jgi:hypothetical protein
VSAQLAAAVNHNDPMIDQLLSIKQAAWLLRNTAGEGSLLVANGLAVGRATPENKLAYTKFVGGIDAAWNALELSASGMQLPPNLAATMAAAKVAYFDPQYMALRDRVMKALVSGEKPEITASEWTPITVDRMASAVTVAERALMKPRTTALTQWSAAQRSLILQLALLAAAHHASIRRHGHRHAPRHHAAAHHPRRDAESGRGDLTVDAGYSDRQDEIGGLAGALETFKKQAMEKAEIEQQERNRNADASQRQQAIEQYIGMFEIQMRDTLGTLGNASDQMNTTSDGMAAVSSQTNARVQDRARFRRSLSERAECRRRGRGAELPRSTISAGRHRMPRASPAAPSIRRSRPTIPFRASPRPPTGSAKWSG